MGLLNSKRTVVKNGVMLTLEMAPELAVGFRNLIVMGFFYTKKNSRLELEK